MNTATELSRPGLSPTVPIPRIRGEAFASVPVEETSSDGASWLSWRMSVAPRILQRLARNRRNGERHVLQDLAAALGGDDDVAAVLDGSSASGRRPARSGCRSAPAARPAA
jgi:hypothetical protein